MSMVINKKHFLITLINLEGVILFFIFIFFFAHNFRAYIFLCFITLSACEGALGLSILVNLRRYYRSDYLMMLNTIN